MIKRNSFTSVMLLCVTLLQFGCATYVVERQITEGTKISFEDFAAGQAVLPEADADILFGVITSYELNARTQYGAAAFHILNSLPENNLAYYNLGVSAEGLGFYDAAIAYYGRAKEVCSWYDCMCGTLQKRFPHCANYDPDSSIERVKNKIERGDQAHVEHTESYYKDQLELAKREIEKDRRKSHAFQNRSVFGDVEIDIDTDKVLKVLGKLAIYAAVIPNSGDSAESTGIKRAVRQQLTGINETNSASTVSPVRTGTSFNSSKSSSSNVRPIRSVAPVSSTIPTSSSCTCKCVNGKVKAICTNTLDPVPICPPQTCPIATPSIKPIMAPVIAPIGTKSCKQAQVYDSQLGRYAWKTVCN